MAEIKTCPFCGSNCEIEEWSCGDSSTIYYRVDCIDNGHSLDCWDDTELEAIETWNERV